MRQKAKVQYTIDGINPEWIEIPADAVPIVGDYFVPDMTTRNGYLVTRRNVFADGTYQLYLKK